MRRSVTPGWLRAPGRCRSTSRHTAPGTSTSAKSASKSNAPNSSRWISGPASQTTNRGPGSVIPMEAPLHVFDDKRLRHPRGVGFQKTPQCICQQFIEVRRPAFLHIRLSPLCQFRRQFGLDHGLIHGRSLARPPHQRKVFSVVLAITFHSGSSVTWTIRPESSSACWISCWVEGWTDIGVTLDRLGAGNSKNQCPSPHSDTIT